MDAWTDKHVGPGRRRSRRGFAVFWRRGVDVSLRNIAQYRIDVDVKEDDGF